MRVLEEDQRTIDDALCSAVETPAHYTVPRPEPIAMYMPANGGWLTAVAMMSADWDGSTRRAGVPPELETAI